MIMANMIPRIVAVFTAIFNYDMNRIEDLDKFYFTAYTAVKQVLRIHQDRARNNNDRPPILTSSIFSYSNNCVIRPM